MNNMRYGHYFTSKKKKTLPETTFIYVKKHGEFNGATPRALRGLLFERHQKNRKKWPFLGIFGMAYPLSEGVGS